MPRWASTSAPRRRRRLRSRSRPSFSLALAGRVPKRFEIGGTSMATQRDGHPRVVGAVLAAGASRRLGRPKQIATLDSEALVRRAVQALTGARCAEVAI